MAQYEMNLRDYWMIVRRRRVIIIVATLAVMALSFWLANQKVQVFQASSAVKFEQSASLSGLIVEVLAYSNADSIETQAALIRSYTILEDVAKRMGAVPTGKDVARDSRAYRGAVEGVGGKLRTNRVGGTSIIEITATSTNPREAADLANTVAEVYRDYNRQLRNARIVEARKYIDSQLKEIQERLKNAEDSMWQFRDQNRIIGPGAESSVLLSLFTQVRLDIEKARHQRVELESILARLQASDRSPAAERIVIESGSPALSRLQNAQMDLLLERNTTALELTDQHPKLQAIDDRLREIRREMRAEVSAQIANLKNREALLTQQMNEVYVKNKEVPAIELGLARLQREAKSNDELAALLKTKRQEALIKEAEVIEEVSIIRPATEPGAPVAGQTFNTVIVGAFLGLVLGLVLAFIQETLDTSIGTIEDVETYLEVPVLGVVPHIDTRATMERLVERRPALAQMDAEALASHALLITHFDPKSPVAEAYRTLRTKIQFARMEQMCKTIVVTSPTLQEGKTTTIVNLALTMAQNGQKTLLVGSNLRRPSIYRFFGIEREPGLSDILVGNAQWRECIRTVADILMGRFEMEDIMASPGLDNLHIIESGAIPANPSELLSTPAMGEFLRNVREEYDIVLIDTPPVLPVTDSTVVASQVDGVVLVYQAGKVGRLVLKRAKIHLESARAKVLGVVLNDVQTEVAGYQYAHYYTHYYGEESTSRPAPTRLGRLWQTVLTQVDRVRGRGGEAPFDAPGAEAPPDGDDATPGDRYPGDRYPGERARRRRGYRNTTMGLVLLAGLTAAFGAALAWRGGWISGTPPKPRATALRERLEARTPEVTVADRPAAMTMSPAANESAPAVTPVPLPAAPSPATVAPAPPVPAAGAVSEPAMPAAAPVALAAPASASPGPRVAAAETEIGAPPSSNGHAVTAARFALELGPFESATEAQRVERRLNEAGYPAVRLRHQAGSAVYAVVLDTPATAAETDALVTALRAQGFAEAVAGGPDEPIRVGELLALRGAVRLAERLRALGHVVRVVTQAGGGDGVSFTVRHGSYPSREEAGEKGEALKRFGLATQIVRIR